ncbi:hypothetical protein CN936_09550 [Bacillus cereus]|uniref:sporulation-delaying protein SdpB family protein n=1 Tax=Bacillus cereus group TaxID=86661 RepID=UPI00065BBE1E|nr:MULTISPECIES: sporulation-delaying protein SdpB family protein [Bacillus cereus group]KMQ23987.1 membrane protein [Bacillus cereus]MBT2200789.1 hypothetical protein [Bacillus thuringiensis]PDY02683.1 hypothetical protein COM66_27005 [Bacillus cereus]PFR41711.1 hypothetical protein COK29_32155 [Bacillus cereus]PGL96635.1 hypothetical protein CN936_09550 [Bacillus cereus]
MFEKIGNFFIKWANSINPWTNVYGLARTIIAVSTLLTLLLNRVDILFRPASGMSEYPICGNNISIFCMVPNDYMYLNIIKWLAIVLLIIIASGWRPRFTGIIHWWICYSLQNSALTLDGGEQVSAVITLLLIPITLTDSRKWHWDAPSESSGIYTKVIALIAFTAIRFQVAILYLHSTVAKLGNQDWINGTAVYYYLQDSMLGLPPILSDIFSPILSSPLIVLPTWGTIIIQFALFAALFAPRKNWNIMLILALCMHEVFALMLGLISFSLIMLGVLVLYLRPQEKVFQFSFFKKIWNSLKGGRVSHRLNSKSS